MRWAVETTPSPRQTTAVVGQASGSCMQYHHCCDKCVTACLSESNCNANRTHGTHVRHVQYFINVSPTVSRWLAFFLIARRPCQLPRTPHCYLPVWQINSCLFSSIQNVHVIITLEGSLPFCALDLQYGVNRV